jgi:hypothetical protein
MRRAILWRSDVVENHGRPFFKPEATVSISSTDSQHSQMGCPPRDTYARLRCIPIADSATAQTHVHYHADPDRAEL